MRTGLSAVTEPITVIAGKWMKARKETAAQVEPLLKLSLIMQHQVLCGHWNINGY